MAGPNPWQVKGHKRLASARRQRAITYRARAIEHLKLANAEPDIRARAELRELAARYEELASELEGENRTQQLAA